MPYVIISTQLQLECGPTRIGDELLDPELADFLGATLIKAELGYDYGYYVTNDVPREVLDKLETKGYRVVASAGIGQTCTWTLHKPQDEL